MFGIWGHQKAAEITYYGLHALQHRGQDGAGLVVSNGETLKLHKDTGLVNDVFKRMDFSTLPGHAAIGHVLNMSKAGVEMDNVQPLVFRSLKGNMAIAHKGNIKNTGELIEELEDEGSILQTNTNPEILAHLIRRNGRAIDEEAIIDALQKISGAFSYMVLTEDKLFVALDPRGIRPISLGKIGDAYVVASETCAFSIVGATFIREILPGELVTISDEGVKSTRFALRGSRKICAMEYIYYSRPDTDLNTVNVHTARKRSGIELAKEAPVEADVVTGVPDSSISAAIGYAEETGIPYEMGVIKNRYVGRTFIQPSQELREQGVKIKLSPVRGIVDGKRVVLIDDSIVRGTTIKRIVKILKEAGAKEVHVRIASPPMAHRCYCGVDVTTKKELISAKHSVTELCEIIEADSLAFITQEGLEKAIVSDKSINQGICQCFIGQFPFADDESEAMQNEKK